MGDRRLRVLVASGPVADRTSRQAAVALATGFADVAEVAVIGLADGGAALGRAIAEPDGEFESVHTGWLARSDGLLVVGAEGSGAEPAAELAGSSADLGRLVRYALHGTDAPARIAIDLTRLDAHDAGAGLVAALGATADVPLDLGPRPLAELTTLNLDPVRTWLGAAELIGLVPSGQTGDQLLGLRGITSRRGRSAGVAAAELLAVDAALERFAKTADAALAEAPGAGAAGGAGFALLALGGRLTSPAAFCAERAGLDGVLAAADLVVTACDSFDFGSRGGGVVTELAQRCNAAQKPLIVVSPVLGMSGREMRVLGVESAHPLADGADTAGALTATGRRLAAGWTARW